MIPFIMKQCLKHGPRYTHHFCMHRMCKGEQISLPADMVSATFQEIKNVPCLPDNMCNIARKCKDGTMAKKIVRTVSYRGNLPKCSAFGHIFLVNMLRAEKRENHYLVGEKCEMCNRKYTRTLVRNQCGSQKRKR